MSQWKKHSKPGRTFWLLLGLIVLATAGPARAQEASVSGETLTVAIKPLVPFVIVDETMLADPAADPDAALSGFSIDLWRDLALELNVETNWLLFETVQEVIDAVADGRADVGIAGISITAEREEQIDFSLPMFNSGLDILSREDTGLTLGDLVALMLSSQVTQIVIVMVIVILIAGNVVWLIERRSNPEFNRAYGKGLFEGIWWAAVTIATVGYGDRTPKSVVGRLVAILWMFIGIALVAQFTAVITSGITLAGIRGAIGSVDDLYGRRVGTVAGTTAELFLQEQLLRPIAFPTFEAAATALLDGGIDAVVYDQPVLLYYAAREGRGRVRTAGQLFVHEYYGIALQQGSPLRERVNLGLLRLRESGVFDAIYDRWFSRD
ncbi:MAG: transporter substrate-binding domain-containing protein [Candidatus Flexifilum sp.]